MRRISAAVLLGLMVPLLATVPAHAASPTVTSPTDGDFVPRHSVTVAGTKEPGARIHIPGVEGCDLPATDADTWECTARGLPNGKGVTLAPVHALNGVDTELEPVTIDVLGAPTITGAPTILTTGIISGYGHPDAIIVLHVASDTHTCPAPVGPDGFWSCVLPVESRTVPVSAQQRFADFGPGKRSDPSPTASVTVDSIPPAAPHISRPAADARLTESFVTFSGTGEPGGRVDVYVDNVIVCTVPVASGLWSCQARVAPGEREVRALQRDAAGNYSSPTAPRMILVVPPADSIPQPGQPSAPSPGEPGGPGEPEPGENPPPAWPPIDEERPDPVPEYLTNWGTPSGFGATIPAPSVASGNVPLALSAAIMITIAAAALFVLLRTVAFRAPRMRLTGRNRPLAAAEEPARSRAHPWIAGIVPLSVAVGFVVFSGGFSGEVRYLRLVFAVGAGLAILNFVGVVVASRLAALSFKVSGRLNFIPLLLVATGVTAFASRVLDVTPPFLVGVIILAVFSSRYPRWRRGAVALVVLVSIAALATASWLLHERLGRVEGFWNSIPSETLATICLAGFGSLLLLVLPFGRMPGRAIMKWSPVVWVIATLALLTVSISVLLGDQFDVAVYLAAMIVTGVVAVIAFAGWAWARWVTPSL